MEEIFKIPLTGKNGCGKYTLIDLEDYSQVSKYKWHLVISKTDNGYAAGYLGKNDKGKNIYIRLHRMITKANATELVDHINRDTLDNRKSNLRICTKLQNNVNTRRRKDNTSGYRGVYWDTQHDKWMAKLTFKGHAVLKKRFTNIKDAALAYNKAAIKYFDEFAELNIL